MNLQEFDAIRAKPDPTREDVAALVAEIERQRAMVQRHIEAYWEAGAKLSRARADIDTLCDALRSVQCLNTVQEVQRLRNTLNTVEAHWKGTQP